MTCLRALRLINRVFKKISNGAKEIVYRSLNRPTMECGAFCWDPFRIQGIKAMAGEIYGATLQVGSRTWESVLELGKKTWIFALLIMYTNQPTCSEVLHLTSQKKINSNKWKCEYTHV